MEQLADRGNGSYYYVDTPAEAERVVVENLTGTLETVANDARIQVEFDRRLVSRYRLIGYENRAIADDSFRDDGTDAGEIGAGHRVTALYEIKLTDTRRRGPIAEIYLRWLAPVDGAAREKHLTLRSRDLFRNWEDASPSLRLAAVVSELAEVLRGSYWARETSLRRLTAEASRLTDSETSKLAELQELIETVERLSDRP